MKAALSSKLDLDNAVERITRSAADLQQASDVFRARQMEGDGSVPPADKAKLRERLRHLDEELNKQLAADYGIRAKDKAAYTSWLRSHEPFHWFIEFHGIMQDGGFDVIIGNPPYLELREVEYRPQRLRSLEGNAIHAMCVERCVQLLRPDGTMSMIVPIALPSTQRMRCVQEILEAGRSVWYANFAWRPAKLFDAVNRALTIFVAVPGLACHTLSTGYQKWTSESRNGLLERMTYVDVPRNRPYFWVPKLNFEIEKSILNKLLGVRTTVAHFVGSSAHKIYYRTTGGLYWKVFTDFAPAFNVNGVAGSSSRETNFPVARREHLKPMIGILSSDLFWWWYTITSNLRDLNPTDIQSFPITGSVLDSPDVARLSREYLRDLVANSAMLVRQQKQTGRTETQSFKIQKSKPIIEELDRTIAPHYGLDASELDFIITYDMKFRLASDDDGSDE